jgi:hypothetical protein
VVDLDSCRGGGKFYLKCTCHCPKCIASCPYFQEKVVSAELAAAALDTPGKLAQTESDETELQSGCLEEIEPLRFACFLQMSKVLGICSAGGDHSTH